MTGGSVGVQVDGWAGWYFEDGFLCTPNGDRFTPLALQACFFYRQLSEVQSLMKCEVDCKDGRLALVEEENGRSRRWIPVVRSSRVGARAPESGCGDLHVAPSTV